MSSTFFGLNIAYSALSTANTALNVTANNIANVNTTGYSRQVASQSAATSLRSYTTYGTVGAGVTTTSIERQRDAFYDFKYWNNQTSVGEYEELYYYNSQIETYLTDDDTIKGFGTIFSEMYAALEELAKNAGDSTVKTQFLGYAENLTTYFNTIATYLEELQTEINDQIKVKVSEINAYAQELASLNQQITVIEMSGGTANELRDQRDAIIDALSLIVDVDITETAIVDADGNDTGATRYVVKIAGGQTLVDGTDYHTLSCVARANYESSNQSDAVGLYDIYWDDGRDFNMTSSSIGGELWGLIQMRDGNNGEQFEGTVSAVGKNDDGLTTVTVDITADYLKSLTTCTLASSGIVTLGSKEYYYDSFSVEYDDDGNITSYTFVISNDTSKNATQPDQSRVGKDATSGVDIEYQGIPYYQQQLNEWVRMFAEAFNAICTQEGSSNDYGDTGSAIFAANSNTDSSVQYTFADYVNLVAGTTLTSTDDTIYLLTAKNFSLNSAVVNDVGLFATHTGETEGESAYDIVTQLINLKDDKSAMSFRGCSASEFLTCLLSDVALNTQTAETMYNNYSNIATTIDNQRLSVSGVDSDEEALNLVYYQHAYNLASQVISILTEMYDRLILNTGV